VSLLRETTAWKNRPRGPCRPADMEAYFDAAMDAMK
jgi:hypothetical protein